MKYFTRELWLSAQNPEQLREYEAAWMRANDEYRAQLKKLESRVNSEAFRFFADAEIHDGELLSLLLKDGSRPAPLSEPVRPWKTTMEHPVQAELTVLEAHDRLVWQISYVSLRRVLIDFPTNVPLFYSDGEGFGDWGYHELTDAGDGFLRHEVLFATGATLHFEFKNVAVHARSRPTVAR
jgi:hypothetical protein